MRHLPKVCGNHTTFRLLVAPVAQRRRGTQTALSNDRHLLYAPHI